MSAKTYLAGLVAVYILVLCYVWMGIIDIHASITGKLWVSLGIALIIWLPLYIVAMYVVGVIFVFGVLTFGGVLLVSPLCLGFLSFWGVVLFSDVASIQYTSGLYAFAGVYFFGCALLFITILANPFRILEMMENMRKEGWEEKIPREVDWVLGGSMIGFFVIWFTSLLLFR